MSPNEQSRALTDVAKRATLISRARCNGFQERYARHWNLMQACEKRIERTLELLDRLKAARVRRLPHLKAAKHLVNGSFDWLAVDEFERLTPAQKEAYLRRLADHLEKELTPLTRAA